jgi:hypothetical protein
VLEIKTGRWIMCRNTMFIRIYHRQKLLGLISIFFSAFLPIAVQYLLPLQYIPLTPVLPAPMCATTKM